MALQALPSPNSADSPSPSPELPSDAALSVDASPVSATTSLYVQPSEETESSNNRSSRSTPTRAMSDLTRSVSAGKGGCWTCRVRRKKCDEEREGESCKTCLRLRIKCLGWGPKRPDWMRDKEKVAAYKASIKEQLSRMGLIRGQPRQPWHSTGLASSQPSTPGVAGPGPQTLRRSMSAREPYHHHHHRRDAGYMPGAPYHVPGLANSIPDADWGHNISASASSSRHPASSSMSFLPSSSSTTLSDPMYPFPSPPLSMAGNEDIPYNGYLPGQQQQQQGMPMPIPPAPSTPAIRQEDYITYYFKHVRELQYVFAGDSLTNILYPIVQTEPDGAVAHSLCALAALHHARMRMARGAPTAEEPDGPASPEQQFYARAHYRILHGPQTHGTGGYADADAVAALQLVAYALLAGGSTDWASPFEVACDWLAQTGLYNEENPKLTLLSMSPAGRFAAKATMFVDIFASITLMQPPRYLSLYKRLFGGGAGYWASAAGSPSEGELRMDALTGCPDEALLAIAEVSALAHWKATELQTGSLSVRELIRRGDVIEKELRERAAGKRDDGEFRTQTPAGAGGLEVGATPAGLPMAMSASASGMSGSSSRAPVDTHKHIIGEMYREAAVLYLHTVLSDSAPGVPEIMASVDHMLKLLNELPPSAYDRTLIFPLFLTGCMTDTLMAREVIKHRFFMQDATMGNILLAQTVMDEVWARRLHIVRSTPLGEHPVMGDWRQSLRMQWANLLLA